MKKQLAILMTVFNRKDKTLACLKALYNCILPNEYMLTVFMMNDSCSDGTEKAVASQFPKVNIIQSNGNLYWNRGMRLAWQTAAIKADFDYYVWLNDDVILFENALSEIINCSETKNNLAMVCGSTCAIENKSIITYGGRIRRVGIVQPNGQMQSCDCCNGQICLIPKAVYKVMGMNDPIFHHGFGDWDYSYRAKKKGFDIIVAPNISGFCDVNANDSFPKYLNSEISLFIRLKILYSPLGKNPFQFFVYTYRHKSLHSAIISFIQQHLEVTFPKK
ncbi:MAG: glycosyltransferase family 2 protein [Bacteroidia bacterium]